jgi:zinc protease
VAAEAAVVAEVEAAQRTAHQGAGVDNKKAESASMRVEQLHDPGLLHVSAHIEQRIQSIEEVRKIIGRDPQGIVAEPPTKDEVDRVKTRIARNMEQQLNRCAHRSPWNDHAVSQGDWRLMFLQHDRIHSHSRRSGARGQGLTSKTPT